MHISPIEFGTPDYALSIRLRDLILRKPLKMQFQEEDLATEYDSYHLAAFDVDHLVVASLIMKPIDTHTVKMRQVAVADNMQGTGIGSRLVVYAETFVKWKGFDNIVLNARATAKRFYLKHMYTTDDKVFQEVGLDHYKMTKKL